MAEICKLCEKKQELIEHVCGAKKDDWRENERRRGEAVAKIRKDPLNTCPMCGNFPLGSSADAFGDTHTHICGNCGWKSPEMKGKFATLSLPLY